MRNALWCLLLVGCGASEAVGPSEAAKPITAHATYVAGVTMFSGDTSFFVQATQGDLTTVQVQVVLGSVVLSDQTNLVPNTDFVAGSRTGSWSLSTDSLSIVWANSGAWVKQTVKVISQGPAENIASGTISGRLIPANALAFLTIQN